MQKCRPQLLVAEKPRLTPDSYFAFACGREVVVDAIQLRANVLVSSGSIRVTESRQNIYINDSVLLAGGSVEVGVLCDSVVVCDGTCRIKSDLSQCLIIARDGVILEGGAVNCLFVTGGKVGRAKGQSAVRCVTKEEEATPLGLVHFFDPARLGVEVAAGAQGGVTVKKVAAQQPFARAGLKAGDELLALGGTAVSSPETFRRVLRRQLAAGNELTFRVRRDGKTLDFKVICKE